MTLYWLLGSFRLSCVHCFLPLSVLLRPSFCCSFPFSCVVARIIGSINCPFRASLAGEPCNLASLTGTSQGSAWTIRLQHVRRDRERERQAPPVRLRYAAGHYCTLRSPGLFFLWFPVVLSLKPLARTGWLLVFSVILVGLLQLYREKKKFFALHLPSHSLQQRGGRTFHAQNSKKE